MEIIKICNLDVTYDFSNSFVIASVSENFQIWGKFLLLASDVVTVVVRRLNVDYCDVEVIVISQDNKVMVHSSHYDFRKKLCDFAAEKYCNCFYSAFENANPELIIEKMKEMHKQARTFSCFYEVVIEPSAGADISDVVKEMKSLSEIIKMPVCAKFNGKNLRITQTTDVAFAVNSFWKNIDTDSVYQ